MSKSTIWDVLKAYRKHEANLIDGVIDLVGKEVLEPLEGAGKEVYNEMKPTVKPERKSK